MKKVVCIGSLNVDILLYMKNFCESDGEEEIKEHFVCPGGQAGNIAVGLGKLGRNSFFFGNIGNDMHTPMLTDNFKKYNVNFSFSKKMEKPNNFVYCLIDKKGDRQIYTYNNIDLSLEDFSDELYDSDFIIFTSIIKEDAIELYTQIAKKAKEKRIKIGLDPGNIFAKLGLEALRPLLELCDYFFPSLSDINLMIGGLENISKISELVPNIMVTCGKAGVKFYKDGQLKNFPAREIKKEKIIDTLGAGDCFVAAFISCLLNEKSEEEAIDFANHAAALSITKKGFSMPSYEEVRGFINEV